MKKMLVRVAVGAMLLWIVNGLPLTGAVQKFNTRQQAMTQMNVPQVFSFQNVHNFGGVVLCGGFPSGEGWGMGMNLNNWFGVEFWPNTTLINSSPILWQGVTVTAIIEVTAISANTRVLLWVQAYNKSNFAEKGNIKLYVTAAGTYTIKSKPFTIEPNLEYEGHCMFHIRVDDPINAQWVRVKVKSIKFDL